MNKKVIIQVVLFLIFSAGLIILLFSLGNSVKIHFFEDILYFFGFETKYFRAYLMGLHSQNGLTQVRFISVLVTMICVAGSFFLSYAVVLLFDTIVLNEDTKIYKRYLKKNYSYDKKNLRFINYFCYFLFVISSAYFALILPKYKNFFGNTVGMAFVFIGASIALFIVQFILYKVILKIIKTIVICIKNTKAWR